jgi:N-acetylglucosamine-6-phosphate deacetylase
MLAFTAARLLTSGEILENPLLLVEQGRIVEIAARSGWQVPASATLADLGDTALAPGYFDLHIHGSAGNDVMDASSDALPAIERLLAQHGVTSYFPTTVTAPLDNILPALERLADAIEAAANNKVERRGRAVPLGIHLEGPFISHARRGVHAPELLLPAKVDIFERFWQASRGQIRMLTIAPEIEGAQELIASAAARGVCVSLGHSDADFATAESAIATGASHATHTFNAMRPLDHRSPGIVGAVLTDARLSADIIADGIHLDPAVVKLFARAKGPEQTVLITDATAAAGMPDGVYHLGSMQVEVKDGKCMSDGKLAGSVLTMDLAVRNLARFAGWDLAHAVAAASRNPARVAGFRNKGVLAAGADADFVVLNAQGEVQRTFIGGVECSR